jgi:hypothetical protein
MGKIGRLPGIESCRRIAIGDLAQNNSLRDRCEWDSRICWPSGFSIEAECRIEPPQLPPFEVEISAGGLLRYGSTRR